MLKKNKLVLWEIRRYGRGGLISGLCCSKAMFLAFPAEKAFHTREHS